MTKLSNLQPPTCDDLFQEEGYERVLQESDNSWRHGTYEYEVYFRESDKTYWSAEFALSSDGETHGLRENTADITQVKPVEVTQVKYVVVK